MAAPNLKSPTTVTGKTARYTATTSLAEALANTSNSNKALRINTIRAANTATSGTISVEVSHYRGAAHSYIAKGVSVAQATALVILQRDEYIYLEEGDSIYIKASSNSSIDITITYEEWS